MNREEINKKDALKKLCDTIAECPFKVSDTQAERLVQYVFELEEWNRKINLTAIRDRQDIVIKHLIDSLFVPHLIDLSGRIIDVGSGGGFPGIPIKIACPGSTVVLVESNRKKANFQKHVIRTLNLQKIEVINQRAQTLYEKEYADICIARAFAEVKTFVSTARSLTRPGGRMVYMGGARSGGSDLPSATGHSGIRPEQTVSYSLPGGRGLRYLLVFRNVSRET